MNGKGRGFGAFCGLAFAPTEYQEGKPMKRRSMVFLLAITITQTIFASGQSSTEYPLTLEVTGFSSVPNGYYTTPRQRNTVGSTTISTGGSMVALSARVNTVILTTPNGKVRCTLWNKRHYLNLGSYSARQTSTGDLEIPFTITKGKKRKQEVWKFRMLSAEKMDASKTNN